MDETFVYLTRTKPKGINTIGKLFRNFWQITDIFNMFNYFWTKINDII